MATLKQRTVSGIKWQVVNKVAQKIISIGTFAILARLLNPSAFGLFAMAFIAIDGLGLFKSAGIDSALIQRKKSSDIANDTAFIIMMALGIAMFLICFLLAPSAASFFRNEKVDEVIQALGIVLLVGSFGRVPSSLLTKDMKFGLLSVIELIGGVLNAVCAIGFAVISPTVWSLVWAYVVKTIAMTAMSLYFSGYKLHFQFDRQISKELISFGKFMLGLGLLGFIATNINNIVIARFLGATALGYFALASNFGDFINTHFTHLISRVMFPAYSEIQNDPDTLRRAYFKTIKFVSMVSLPFAIVLITLSQELILTLYGDQWLSIVPLIQLFGILQIVVPIAVCSGSLFLANGMPKYLFNINLASLVIRVPLLIVLTYFWDLPGAVYSQIITTAVIVPIDIYILKKLLGFKVSEFARAIFPSFICSLIMVGAILLVKTLVYYESAGEFGWHFIMLSLYGGFGLLAYLFSFFIIDPPTCVEAKKLMFNLE